jgi:hypothetical protein
MASHESGATTAPPSAFDPADPEPVPERDLDQGDESPSQIGPLLSPYDRTDSTPSSSVNTPMT